MSRCDGETHTAWMTLDEATRAIQELDGLEEATERFLAARSPGGAEAASQGVNHQQGEGEKA